MEEYIILTHPYHILHTHCTLKDSREDRPTQADDDAYHLIMRDKERLLDTNEPLRFIFSHSALWEGWDSPNVFQICTLNETGAEKAARDWPRLAREHEN